MSKNTRLDPLFVLKAVALSLCYWGLVEAALTVRAARAAVETLPSQLQKQIDHVADGIKQTVDDKADSAIDSATFAINQQGDSVVREIRTTRAELMRQIITARLNGEAKADSALKISAAAVELGDYHADVLEKELNTTNLVLAAMARPTRDLVTRMAEDVPATLASAQHAADSISAVAPGLAKSTEKIEADADRLVQAADRIISPWQTPSKRPWWIRIGERFFGRP